MASGVGKGAIVTGGSQGVGLGIARTFLQAGAALVTCARSDFDQPPAAGTEAMAALLLTDPEQRRAYAEGIPVGRMGTPAEIGEICLSWRHRKLPTSTARPSGWMVVEVSEPAHRAAPSARD